MIASMPMTVRQVRATEEVLNRLYLAAKKGLKRDTLALAAGLLPAEFAKLQQMDPLVDQTVAKGRADLEQALAEVVINAALVDGDYKAALSVLERQNPKDWQAPKESTPHSFGSGGIQIIIGDVSQPKQVEGHTIEQLP